MFIDLTWCPVNFFTGFCIALLGTIVYWLLINLTGYKIVKEVNDEPIDN